MRIDEARARYIATAFCYGCNLGPTQTAQSLGAFDRRQLAWIDSRHITEDTLDAAITTLINAYNRFALPKFWGSEETYLEFCTLRSRPPTRPFLARFAGS